MTTTKFNTFSLLELSTAHLSKEAAENLDGLDPQDFVAYAKYDYGWFVPVLDRVNLNNLPDSLREIMFLAKGLGVDWIMFDQDADVHPSLPIYSW